MVSETFVIAEAGSNHHGELKRAFELIDIAKWAGADACKFQYWSDSEKLAGRRNAPELMEFYQKWRTPKEWLIELKSECDRLEVEFMCSCYLPQDIETVAPLVKRFKIASFEAGDEQFIELHQIYEKEILVSHSMGQERIVKNFVVPILCVSAYPCPDEQINLLRLQSNYYWGLSDHTKNPLTGALAAACGAKYIETHFRSLDTPQECPDFTVARNPYELRRYIDNIRQAEILLGDGQKRIQECERENLRYRVGLNP